MKVQLVLGICVLTLLVGCSVQQSYEAEGYFVIDDKVIELYQNENAAATPAEIEAEITKDVDYFLTQANILLATMSPSLDIQIRRFALKFETATVIQGSSAPPQAAIAAFDSYLSNTNANSNYNYDFAVLYTAKELVSSRLVYHAGQICKQATATAVINYRGNYEVAIETAKAVAHILGAGNDGYASEYVMNRNSQPDDSDRWSFSQCTATDINQFIEKYPNQASCLSSSSSSVVPSVSVTAYDGQIYNYDDMCRRYFKNETSQFCRYRNLYNNQPPKGDAICSKVYCLVPGSSNSPACRPTYATEGFICDQGKRCKEGSCQPDSSTEAANADPDCLFDDVEVLSMNSANFVGTCSEYLEQQGSVQCQSSFVNDSCCSACRTAQENEEDESTCANQYGTQTCENHLDTYGDFQCYFQATYDVCCQSCEDRKMDSPPNCAWGDRSSACGDYTEEQICPNSYCCYYCRNWTGGNRRRRSANGAEIQISIPPIVEVDPIPPQVNQGNGTTSDQGSNDQTNNSGDVGSE